MNSIYDASSSFLKLAYQDLATKVQQAEIDETRITDAPTFSSEIREGIIEADGNFAKQREIVEALNVIVTLTVEDGIKIIYPEFIFKGEKCQLLYNDTIMV